MNKLSLTVLALFALAAAEPQSFLTKDETKTVLREIDNICGDTWCEGDFNYSFDRLVCNASECFLDIQLINRSDDRHRPYRCELKGFQEREDLLSPLLSYSEKLYTAVGSCINDEIPQRLPVIYLPKSSACLSSLRQKPYFKSAAHSAYAEVFYDLEDKAQASATTLNQMVESYAKKDASCSLEYVSVFQDEISCERMGISEVCSLPTDLGRFVVIKDSVDGAAVIYIEKTGKKASLGTTQGQTLNLSLAQPEFCYTELLNLDGSQKPQTPFDSSDHHNYFVSTKNLKLSQDARENSVQLINSLVKSLANKKGGACEFQTAKQALEANTCQTLGGIDICVVMSPNAGSFVVTKDAAEGAYVSFLRYD